MKNRKRGIWLSLLGSLLLIGCSLVLGAGSRPGGLVRKLVEKSGGERSVQIQPSVVVSDGLKLQILDIKQLANDVIEVVIKNGYQKNITAIAASAGGNQSFHTDFTYAESESNQKIPPGGSDRFLYTPTRLDGVLPQVIVSAVIFQDGGSKGDKGEVTEILDKRLGMKIQLNRIMPYLERLDKLKNSNDSLVRLEVAKLKTISEALPIEKGNGSSTMSPGMERGLAHGRDFILHYLSKLETALLSRGETFNQNITTPDRLGDSREDQFQVKLLRIQRDFKGLADRL